MGRPYTAPAILALAALAVYLPGVHWGAPHATAPERAHSWGVDDLTPLGPLAEMHNIIQPKPDRNLGYPLMHPFVVTAAYVPYLAYLKLSGGLPTVSGVYPYGLSDPEGSLEGLSLIAHLVSVVMAAITVVAAYDAGRALWGHCTGVWAGVFTLLSYPMFYYARTGNVDVPVLCFTALALAAFARILAGGYTVRRAAWLGTFTGCALATKEPSAASFIALPVVISALFVRNDRGVWAGFAKPSLVGLAAAIMAFGLGSGLFVDPGRYVAHVEFARQRIGELAAGEVPFLKPFPNTWEGNAGLAGLTLARLADAMTLPGLVLAVTGVCWCTVREPRAALFALPAVSYLLVLFVSARAVNLRYVMPAAFTLGFFAARAVTLAREAGPVLGASFATAAVVALGWNALRGIDLTHAMLNDSRYSAGEWLANRASPGDRVEYFGPSHTLPPIPAGVSTERAIPYLGGIQAPPVDDAAVREIAAGWRHRRPNFIVLVPDHTSPPGSAVSGCTPPAVVIGLAAGGFGYRPAAVFQAPALLPWVRRPGLDYPTVNPPVQIFTPMTEGPTK